MTLAESFANKTARSYLPPAAKCHGEPPHEATPNDVEHLAGATFLNDGLTVILRDGTMLTRTRKRERWVELQRTKDPVPPAPWH